jgi:hypothetical protein
VPEALGAPGSPVPPPEPSPRPDPFPAPIPPTPNEGPAYRQWRADHEQADAGNDLRPWWKRWRLWLAVLFAFVAIFLPVLD